MEALADFGTVATFSFRTLTEGVYRVWHGMFDRVAATQLAAILLGWPPASWRSSASRAGAPGSRTRAARPAARAASTGGPGVGATLLCLGTLGLAFGLPVGQLIVWAIGRPAADSVPDASRRPRAEPDARRPAPPSWSRRVAVLLAYAIRRQPTPARGGGRALAGLGYALPGAVIAVGVLVPLGLRSTGRWRRALAFLTGVAPGLLLTGSAGRPPLRLSRPVPGGGKPERRGSLTRIPRSLDEAARSLGAGGARTLRAIHLPLARRGLLVAGTLVFVDVMKELPATLLLRPLGFETLAVVIWRRTAEALWVEAAAPALALVLAGLGPVVLAMRASGARPAARTPGGAASAVSLLRLTGVTKRFARDAPPAVDDLSLERGGRGGAGAPGPSGCGKTTTLRLVAGFEAPDAGVIEIRGRKVAGPGRAVPPEARGVGVVFQDYALFPHLAVEANVAFGLAHSPRAARLRAGPRGAGAGGAGRARRPLSARALGGQQQRVALARALAPAPALILLDEPFSNLDADLRAAMREEIGRILRPGGTTAIFVTHDQQEAFALADRVGVLNAGRLEQVAPPYEVYHRPGTRFVAEFVGAADFLPVRWSPRTGSSPSSERWRSPAG